MNLQNGKYYSTADGTVVKAQMQADGRLHCYDAMGSEIHTIKLAGHVEGWRPVGKAEFKKARTAAKSKPKDIKLKTSAKLEVKTSEKKAEKK